MAAIPMSAESRAAIEKMIADAVAQQVSQKTKGILDKIEPLVPALEKAAATAASRTGMSPQEVFAKMAGDGNGPAYGLSQDGMLMPLAPRRDPRRCKSIGRRKNEDTGHVASFGEFVHHNWRVNQLGVRGGADSLEQLVKMGAYTTRQGDDGKVVKTALAESSGVTGGYGVPPQFLPELQRLSIELQTLGARCRRLAMDTATLTVPSLDHTTVYGAGVTPFLGGVQGTWASETGLITESEPGLRQTELRANQLSLFMLVSNVLMQDQVVNLDALLTELLTEADAFYTDLAFIRGNGAGQPLGVQNANAAIQIIRQSANHVTWQDIRAMYARMIYNNQEDLMWIGSPSVVDDILGMNDQQGSATGIGTGRMLWVPYDQGAQGAIDRPAGKQSFGKLLGVDFFLSEKMFAKGTLGDLMLVDASKYLAGERMDAQIEASPHPYFKTYQTVIRCVSRRDGQPWLSGPVTLADGATTQSPFIVLD